ncbi:hypothetical protein NLG97_g3035 [Lecanicillium saksenae]|uniref:Uncharacterized protein n=1 Tax=Lecanicillium saksenae TaxID=468837 RepID=A0ACC1R394_9HYPO|nr:hypothetical protein NLG97_g3035 [Lecanicillium saksenae]
MKLQLTILLVSLIASALPPSLAQTLTNNSSLSLADILIELPACSFNCLLAAVARVGCGPLDKPCICQLQYKNISGHATPCIAKACTFMEALHAKNLTEVACDAPVRSKSRSYNTLAITMRCMTNLLVITRLAFKRWYAYHRSLGWDDYVILIDMFVGTSGAILNARGLVANGLGRDIWTLSTDTINKFGKFFYATEVLYLVEIGLIKLSFSVFYLNIFPCGRIRHILWLTLAVNVASGVCFVVIGIVQCMPISFAWLRYTDLKARGRCIDTTVFGWSQAIHSIALDLWMIAIPLSQLSKLQLHWKKKLGASVMLLTGTCITVVSILRLQSLVTLAQTYNSTWDQEVLAWWSTIEVHVSIICACLPTLRLQFFNSNWIK